MASDWNQHPGTVSRGGADSQAFINNLLNTKAKSMADAQSYQLGLLKQAYELPVGAAQSFLTDKAKYAVPTDYMRVNSTGAFQPASVFGSYFSPDANLGTDLWTLIAKARQDEINADLRAQGIILPPAKK